LGLPENSIGVVFQGTPDSKYIIPTRATKGSAAYDLYAPGAIDRCTAYIRGAVLQEGSGDRVSLKPGAMIRLGLGFSTIIPPGYMGVIASRSGMGSKGLVVTQGIGIIDSDYRGTWAVPLTNRSDEMWSINTGDRVAQVFFLPTLSVNWVSDEVSDTTERGSGGFGSTGG